MKHSKINPDNPNRPSLLLVKDTEVGIVERGYDMVQWGTISLMNPGGGVGKGGGVTSSPGRRAVVQGLLAGARLGLRALARPTGGMPGL